MRHLSCFDANQESRIAIRCTTCRWSRKSWPKLIFGESDHHLRSTMRALFNFCDFLGRFRQPTAIGSQLYLDSIDLLICKGGFPARFRSRMRWNDWRQHWRMTVPIRSIPGRTLDPQTAPVNHQFQTWTQLTSVAGRNLMRFIRVAVESFEDYADI